MGAVHSLLGSVYRNVRKIPVACGAFFSPSIGFKRWPLWANELSLSLSLYLFSYLFISFFLSFFFFLLTLLSQRPRWHGKNGAAISREYFLFFFCDGRVLKKVSRIKLVQRATRTYAVLVFCMLVSSSRLVPFIIIFVKSASSYSNNSPRSVGFTFKRSTRPCFSAKREDTAVAVWPLVKCAKAAQKSPKVIFVSYYLRSISPVCGS